MKLICGDALDVLPTLESESVDMVLADPPYGGGTTACVWDSVIPLAPLWEQLCRIVKPQGAIAICCKQPFTSSLITSNREMFRYCWYWEKSKGANFAQTGFRPLAVIEEVAVFSHAPAVYSAKPTMRYHAQREKLARPHYRKFAGTLKGSKETRSPSAMCRNPERLPEKTYTETTPRNLLYAADDGEDGLHPTQKPVALMAYLVRTYTQKGETVLDFCMGSGSTGVACLNEWRDFIGIERDEGYHAIATKRLGEAQSMGPLFAGIAENG